MVSDNVKDDHVLPFALPDGREINIRDTFAKSGCYDAATLAPLWQVEWYTFPYCLGWSPDFSNVARLNIHGIEHDPDFPFTMIGQLTKEYNCNFLLTGLRSPYLLPFSTWDWHTQWYDKFEVEGNRLALSTVRRRLYIYGFEINLGLQEFYEFDLGTGEVASFRSEGGWVMWVYLLGLLAAGGRRGSGSSGC